VSSLVSTFEALKLICFTLAIIPSTSMISFTWIVPSNNNRIPETKSLNNY